MRITTRGEPGRAAIEAVGAECWIGTPDRVATLRYALEGVTLACWLLGTACGEPDEVAALHGSRLEFFLGQTIDTTVRGLLYEAAGSVDPAVLAAGRELIGARTAYNAIPLRGAGRRPARSRAMARAGAGGGRKPPGARPRASWGPLARRAQVHGLAEGEPSRSCRIAPGAQAGSRRASRSPRIRAVAPQIVSSPIV